LFLTAKAALRAGIARRPALILASIGAIHRAIILLRFRPAMDHLANDSFDLAQIQFYPIAVYRQHFLAGLWLLQQTPPVPHLVLKAALTIADLPYGFTYVLFVLQAAISIATAILLCFMVRRVTGSVVAGFLLALWFLLSTDLLVLENDFGGQSFYENLGMLLVAACCAAMVRDAACAVPPSSKRAACLGLYVALAALTRSSLCYYVFIPILATIPKWRARTMAAYLAPVLLLQGGWALKNAVLYGDFAWETSSWGGYSAAKGLAADGQDHELCNDIRSGASAYPAWFVASIADCPFPFANSQDDGMPARVQAQDAATRVRLGGVDVPLNSLAARMKSAEYKAAILRYARAHPLLALRRFIDLYPVFWQRMADYGFSLVDVFVVDPVKRGLPDLLSRGLHEKQRVETAMPVPGSPPPTRAAAFGTVSLAPLDAASIVALHAVFPLLLLAAAWRRVRVLAPGTAVLGWTVVYGLIVFNAVDSGENMRFRLAVEPEIIALTAACGAAVLGLRRRKVGGDVPSPPNPPSFI
jgi:hypothetical protein